MAKGFNRPMGAGKSAGGMGGGNMMNQLKAMQEKMEVMQAQVALETVTASVGGGVVKVTMTGDQQCRSIEIKPEILVDADAEMLQDLILSAVNSALDQSRELSSSRMASITGGMPGMGF